MKKFVKFLLGVGAVAGSVAGVMYFLNKKKDGDFEDFDDDDFEDVFDDEEEDRDYVTLDFDGDGQKEEAAEEKKEEPAAEKAEE